MALETVTGLRQPWHYLVIGDCCSSLMPSAGSNNPVAPLLSSLRASAQMRGQSLRIDLIVKGRKKKSCRGRGETAGIAFLLYEQLALPRGRRTGCVTGLWWRKRTNQWKRRYTSGGGLIYDTHHTRVCHWVDRPDLSSKCLKAFLKSESRLLAKSIAIHT